MSTIAVNLLPKEFLTERKSSSKASGFNSVSIFILIILIGVTAVVLVLRFQQVRTKNDTQARIERDQAQLANLSDRETKLITLKERLSTIKTLLGTDETRRTLYTTIIGIVPSDMEVADMTIDKNNNVDIQVVTKSLDSVSNFISDLGSKEKTNGLVKKMNLDGLSFNNDAGYRVGLKIQTK